MLYTVSLRPTLTLSPAGESRSHRICKNRTESVSQSRRFVDLRRRTADASPGKDIFAGLTTIKVKGMVAENYLNQCYEGYMTQRLYSFGSVKIKSCAT